MEINNIKPVLDEDFETLQEIIERRGQPSFHFSTPIWGRGELKRSQPSEYVVWFNEDVPGGCIIAAKFGSSGWVVNPNDSRSLVRYLIEQGINSIPAIP